MFDNQNKLGSWKDLCKAVGQFPKGLIEVDYRPGALATGVNIAHYWEYKTVLVYLLN